MQHMRYCVVKSCSNHYGTTNVNLHMFRLPKDAELKKKWINSIQEANGCNFPGFGKICAQHFLPECIQINCGRVKLTENAVPTEFWVDCIEVKEDNDQEVEIRRLNENITKMKLEFEEKEGKMRKKITELTVTQVQQTAKIKSLEKQLQIKKLEKKQLQEDLKKEKLRTQLKTKNVKPLIDCFLKGIKPREKYPDIVRDFCLMIFTLSVRAYVSIRKYFDNNLPHVGTLRAWYANCALNCQPGIHDSCSNIIKKKVEQKKSSGSELVVSVVFDEMHIRKIYQFNNSRKCVMGYRTYGTRKTNDDDVANQAIVFMVCGINEKIRLPIAYHFIQSLNAIERKQLVSSVIDALIGVNAKVANITFDGFTANLSMCKLLGANLDVLSNDFQPYFIASNGDKIRIIMDVCHMEKLVRGVIGNKEVIQDSSNHKIKWQYFEKLVEFNKKGFGITHKLTRNHIDWKARKMKVNLAVQLLSASTASSMEYLMEQGFEEFVGAERTIEFTRMFNSLFDVFNSKSLHDENPSKQALNPMNKDQFFQFFHSSIQIIKEFKISNQNGRLILLTRSRSKTGFVGYIINMYSLMSIYSEYVEEKGILSFIPTYNLNQDPLEIFFGKIRSLNGYNDNPSVQDFQSAYRKLLVYSTVCTSKGANCYDFDLVSEPFTDILFVSSRRAKVSSNNDDEAELIPDDLEKIHERLSEVTQGENCSLIDFGETSTNFIANQIEARISRPERMYCEFCAKVFIENDKMLDEFIGSRPCRSTVSICREADRFIKLEILKGDINISSIYYAILQNIDIDSLFRKTNFTHQQEHKLCLIKGIIDTFIQGTHIAKMTTFGLHKKQLRIRLRKLIHIHGQ